VSESKRTFKERVFHGMREYLLISLYLFVVFSLFATYKAVILAEHQIELVPQGLALINALALGKVILFGEELHMANQFRDAPLIYPTLLKSFVYTFCLLVSRLSNKRLWACIMASCLAKASLISLEDLGRDFGR
jgi:hypothetical protein